MSNNLEEQTMITETPLIPLPVPSNPSTNLILASESSNFPTSEDILTFFGFVLFANMCINAYKELKN